MLKNNIIKRNDGVALVVTILLMSLILFLTIYFLNFSLIEERIARSQVWGAKTYYLAEAGIADMVWKLKNDATYKNNFETNASWTETITRDEPFGSGSGSYSVTITNSDLAHGEIVSTGSINVGAGATQRVVKTYVFRALGSGGIPDTAGYADGNIDISTSNVNFNNGAAHSNLNFTVNGTSNVNVAQDLEVVGNLIESGGSTVIVLGTTYASNNANGPAAEVDMPAVDFDSSDPSSYINQADIIYTQSEFDDLMDGVSTLTLNDPITYVTGDVDFYGGKTLEINGLLVVERDFQIGRQECRSQPGGPTCGFNTLIINDTSSSTPSGILAKRKAQFKSWTGDVNLSGVVYANDQLDIINITNGYEFNVNGGLVSRKLTATSVLDPVEITYNEFIVDETLPASDFSPVITVEHWEEEY